MNEVIGFEKERDEAFDWHHMDLINNPPYDHYNMIIALHEGRFIVEGKKSGDMEVDLYADYHDGEPEVFKALDDIENDDIRLSVDGITV